MKHKNAYTIFYAVLLGLACAAIPMGYSIFTKPFYDANKKLDEDKNVLKVLGIDYDAKLPAQDLVALFDTTVEKKTIGEGASQLLLFYAKSDAKAVAFNFIGSGIWGKIYGYLALESDLRTIKAFTVYRHEETPGLGGEIEKDWFKKEFVGKKIVDANDQPGFKILRFGMGASAPNEIDGISGATLTGNKLMVILDGLSKKIVKINKEELHVGQ